MQGQDPAGNRLGSLTVLSTADISARDPVCGMNVITSPGALSFAHQGKRYYFCCANCQLKFKMVPDQFLSASPLLTNMAADDGQEYFCPMCPGEETTNPGVCSQCGMALQPSVPSATSDKREEEDTELRLRVSAVFTVLLLILSMPHMLKMGSMGQMNHGTEQLVSCWLQLLLATPVVLWAAQPFFQRAWTSVVNRRLNMFSLLAMGISIPYAYSLVSLVWETAFPTAGRGDHVVHFETAAMITTLAWLGQFLELRARLKSTSAIHQLWSLLPQTATVVFADDSEDSVEVTQLLEGCLVRIRAGDKVPADGYLLSGTGSLDESAFTGEPMPVHKEVGATVKAGMLNHDGSFIIRTTAVGTRTMLSQIVHMVSAAQRSRVPMQQLVDGVAAAFVPIVAIVAVVSFASWLYAGAGILTALTVVTSVFVVACPCALGLATPMSIVVAIGRAALSGILVKDARSLQALTNIKTIIFDKTGTLTEGKPALVAIVLATGASEEEALGLAASLSKGSSHPLSSAITAEATTRGLSIPECHEFTYTPGGGSTAKIGDRLVVLGNTRFLNKMGISVDSVPTRTSSYLAVDGQVLAQLEFEDPVKPSAQQAVRSLQMAGMRLILATGDGAAPAHALATQLGITDVRTQQTPEDKLNLIRQLQSEGTRVAMVGDGVNDAPALAQADVGIAMSTGSDIAVDSAGITLVRGDLAGVDLALKVSRAMINNIRQNLVLAFAYNVIAVPIAAGILLPAFGLLLNPMVAAFAMSASSLAVVGNALRLRRLSL